MRRIAIIAALVLISVFAQAQSQAKYEIKESEKKVFCVTEDTKSSEPVMTGWTFMDKEGNEFPIYMSKSGSCFVYKARKDGSQGKYYLGKETSMEICRRMNVEYKSSRR